LSPGFWLRLSGAAGPISAGLIADRWGTFTPIFVFYALVLFLLAVPVLLMRAPRTPNIAKIAADDYGTATPVAEPA
jgi:hypothetical protein